MKQVVLSVVALAILASSPATAAMFGPDFRPCGDKKSTLEVVDCVNAKTKVWDKRLNTAFKDLQQRIDDGQREPLRIAERLWLQFRDANCAFYGAAEGSIRQVQAAECLRATTQDRALELEQAMTTN